MGNQRGRPMKARPRLLQTACELFLKHGLDVSLDTIASEAGTSRPTLYSHFPGGKDALLLESFSFLNDKMQPPLRQLLLDKQHDLPALLLGFARVVQAHFYTAENIRFQRLLIQVLVQKPELYNMLEQCPAGQVLPVLTEILTQQKTTGRITLHEPDLQATLFLGAVMGFPLPSALITQKPVDPARLATLAESAVTTFLAAWQYRSESVGPDLSR